MHVQVNLFWLLITQASGLSWLPIVNDSLGLGACMLTMHLFSGSQYFLWCVTFCQMQTYLCYQELLTSVGSIVIIMLHVWLLQNTIAYKDILRALCQYYYRRYEYGVHKRALSLCFDAFISTIQLFFLSQLNNNQQWLMNIRILWLSCYQHPLE